MDERSNVVSFPGRGPIFNAEVRKKLVEGVTPHTGKPLECVNAFEQVICSFIVQKVRDWLVKIATQAGDGLGKKITK